MARSRDKTPLVCSLAAGAKRLCPAGLSPGMPAPLAGAALLGLAVVCDACSGRDAASDDDIENAEPPSPSRLLPLDPASKRLCAAEKYARQNWGSSSCAGQRGAAMRAGCSDTRATRRASTRAGGSHLAWDELITPLRKPRV